MDFVRAGRDFRRLIRWMTRQIITIISFFARDDQT
jgi:hypothetical protein